MSEQADRDDSWLLSDLDLVALQPWSQSPVLAAAPDASAFDRDAKLAGLAALVERELVGPESEKWALEPRLSVALDVRREPQVVVTVETRSGDPLLAHVSWRGPATVLEQARGADRLLVLASTDDACLQLALALCSGPGARCVVVRQGEPPQLSVVDVAPRGEHWLWHSGGVQQELPHVPAVAAMLAQAVARQQ